MRLIEDKYLGENQFNTLMDDFINGETLIGGKSFSKYWEWGKENGFIGKREEAFLSIWHKDKTTESQKGQLRSAASECVGRYFTRYILWKKHKMPKDMIDYLPVLPDCKDGRNRHADMLAPITDTEQRIDAKFRMIDSDTWPTNFHQKSEWGEIEYLCMVFADGNIYLWDTETTPIIKEDTKWFKDKQHGNKRIPHLCVYFDRKEAESVKYEGDE